MSGKETDDSLITRKSSVSFLEYSQGVATCSLLSELVCGLISSPDGDVVRIESVRTKSSDGVPLWSRVESSLFLNSEYAIEDEFILNGSDLDRKDEMPYTFLLSFHP